MSLPRTPSFQHINLYLINNLSSLIRPSLNKFSMAKTVNEYEQKKFIKITIIVVILFKI
jgi:hypothetical protein